MYEEEILEFFEEFKALNNRYPKKGEIFEKFSNLEMVIIASTLLPEKEQFPVEDLLTSYFKNIKDDERIEELVERYIGYPKLSDLLVPKNVAVLLFYKDDKDFHDQAKELVNILLTQDSKGYYEEILDNPSKVFENSVGIQVLNLNVDEYDLSEVIYQKIRSKNEVTSVPDQEIDFNTFYLLKLNLFNYKISSPEQITALLEKRKKVNSAELSPLQKFKVLVIGQIGRQELNFQVALDNLNYQLFGLNTFRVKKVKNFSEVVKDAAKDVSKDYLLEELAEALADKILPIKEIKVGKKLVEVLMNSAYETVDFASNRKAIIKIAKEVESRGCSLKEYYINEYLHEEFEQFFKENNLEYVRNDFNSIFNRLYNSFVQKIESLYPEDAHQKMLIKESYVSAPKGVDETTTRFLFAAAQLKNNTLKSTSF